MNYAIIGLQYGSEAKGSIAGYIAKTAKIQKVYCNYTPNAGHTFRYDGVSHIHRMIPVGVHSIHLQSVMWGPGSVIDPLQLLQDLMMLRDEGVFDRLRQFRPRDPVNFIIHPNACILLPGDSEAEARHTRIGSTAKGTAEALSRRMERVPPPRPGTDVPTHPLAPEGDTLPARPGVFSQWADTPEAKAWHQEFAEIVGKYDIRLYDGWDSWNYYHDKKGETLIEGCQGFSLSIHNGFYPYVTSRDTTFAQLCADTTFDPRKVHMVIGASRTFPIRVNNRDGWSGPCYPDQREISWDELGVDPEKTTVTQLERRVFTFSMDQMKDACRVNGVDAIYLSHCDYLEDDKDREDLIRTIQKATNVGVRYHSAGPDIRDMRIR